MAEKSFYRGLLAAELLIWMGCAYWLARSAATGAEWWLVLTLAILCIQGLVVLYMTAYRSRYGVPEPYPALRIASTALTCLGLLFALFPVYGPRVLSLLHR